MRRALKDAVRWGLLARNVADLADAPSSTAVKAQARKSMRTWTTQQLRRFLEFNRQHPLYAAFLLAAMTGMRRGEVLGLRWADVDLDGERLSVTQTLVAPRHRLVITEPKTAAGRRMSPLTGSPLPRCGNTARGEHLSGWRSGLVMRTTGWCSRNWTGRRWCR
jgi:integrase